MSGSAAKNFLAALPLAGFEFFVVGAGGELCPEIDFEPANLLAVPQSKKERLANGVSARASRPVPTRYSADASTATGIVEASGNSVMHTRSNHREAHLTEFDRSLAKTHQFTSATVRSHVQHNCVLPEKPESASDSSNSVVEWIRSLSE